MNFNKPTVIICDDANQFDLVRNKLNQLGYTWNGGECLKYDYKEAWNWSQRKFLFIDNNSIVWGSYNCDSSYRPVQASEIFEKDSKCCCDIITLMREGCKCGGT